MERTITIAGSAVVLALAAFAAYRFWANPMADRRQTLAAQLEAITPLEVPFEKPNWDFEGWQGAVAAKPALWKELVPPPPPPPPRPEPPPDLNKMLKGVKVLRASVGNKVKVVTPQDQRGTFLGVGDSVGGLRIKEISKTSVTFSLNWKGQELTVSLNRE